MFFCSIVVNDESQHVISWQHNAKGQGSLSSAAHTTYCWPGIVWSVLNITQLRQLIARAATEIALVETGHSICSALTLKVVQWRERLFKKTQAAQMKWKPGVKLKWNSFKVKFNAAHFKITSLLHRQHTLLCHLKVSRRRRRSKFSPIQVITGGDIQYFQGQKPQRKWTKSVTRGSRERRLYWFQFCSHMTEVNHKTYCCTVCHWYVQEFRIVNIISEATMRSATAFKRGLYGSDL